jgi:hypothetical protein
MLDSRDIVRSTGDIGEDEGCMSDVQPVLACKLSVL